ncbi:hypothetical protein Cni_G17494 [Canna indica]|uniref:RING-type E3 ubiquitin transferase n=1 Tax=Canna indica TaxID=4628 RepID=A0AAQ3KMT5_9LILI|nr:hypothetical protein Cni_G17494 [Canna indica]
MAAMRYRRPIDIPPIAALLPLLSLLLLIPRCALAQSSPPSNSSNSNNDNGYYGYGKFNPTMAVVIVVMITTFFFLGFFSIYIRNCSGDDDDYSFSFRRRPGGGAAQSRRQQGLSPEVIETFPRLVYAEVKGHKLGKSALECAVCLSEFDDDEELRLLPHCSHVFHPDCIDAWLASHVTCPVCRANLAVQAATDPPPAAAADAEGLRPETTAATQDHIAIVVDRAVIAAEVEEERKEAAVELARIGSQRRAARSRSGRRPAKFPRSHSTGHSVVRPVEDVDRYTLRLPEHMRKEIFASRKFHRSTSCVAFPTAGEGSSHRSRRGWGGGDEGSSRGWRSFRLRKSDRWPSFFLRTLSVKVPAWATGRRGESEGSVKKGDGDCSARGKTVA